MLKKGLIFISTCIFLPVRLLIDALSWMVWRAYLEYYALRIMAASYIYYFFAKGLLYRLVLPSMDHDAILDLGKTWFALLDWRLSYPFIRRYMAASTLTLDVFFGTLDRKNFCILNNSAIQRCLDAGFMSAQEALSLSPKKRMILSSLPAEAMTYIMHSKRVTFAQVQSCDLWYKLERLKDPSTQASIDSERLSLEQALSFKRFP